MAVKKLIQVWDGEELVADNIAFLKNQTKPILLPPSENIQLILNDLLETYQATPCAGVAANQIGYDKRIFIGLKYDDYDDGYYMSTDHDEDLDDAVFVLVTGYLRTPLTSWYIHVTTQSYHRCERQERRNN